MLTIARLQEYLRHSARQQYESITVPCFTLFFHPADPLTFFNYAIPDEPCGEGLAASLFLARTEFARHCRRPRFEFLEAFAPELGPALQAAGFVEEARQPLMICTAETYRAAPEVTRLTIARLDGSSTVSRMREFLTVQRRGFDFQNQEAATEADFGAVSAKDRRRQGIPGGVEWGACRSRDVYVPLRWADGGCRAGHA